MDRPFHIALLIALACLCGVTTPASAQQPQAAEDPLTTRTYDVRDLLAPWQEELTQDPTQAQLAAYRVEALTNLIDRIKSGSPNRAMTDDPADANPAGGVSESGGRLRVRTTPAHHTAIARLLEDRRMQRRLLGRNSYQLLLIDPATFAEIFTADTEGTGWHARGSESFPAALAGETSGVTGYASLNDAQAEHLLTWVRQAGTSNFVMQQLRHTEYTGEHTNWGLSGHVTLPDHATPINLAVGQIQTSSTIAADPALTHFVFHADIATATGALVQAPDPDAGQGVVRAQPELNRAEISFDIDLPANRWYAFIGPAVSGKVPSPITGSFFGPPGEPDTAGFDTTRQVVWLVHLQAVELIEPKENESLKADHRP